MRQFETKEFAKLIYSGRKYMMRTVLILEKDRDDRFYGRMSNTRPLMSWKSSSWIWKSR